MKTRRYAASRQKACLTCVAAKAKCDRKPRQCSRCSLRNIDCRYSCGHVLYTGRVPDNNIDARADTQIGLTSDSLTATKSFRPSLLGVRPDRQLQIAEVELSQVPAETTKADIDNASPNFADVESWSATETTCSINPEDISNRWLNSYVPLPGQRPKSYSAPITAYIHKTLKSYAALTVRGRGVPPFVHPSQCMETSIKVPLSTCLTLVRICEAPAIGSVNAVSDIIQREMTFLYEDNKSFDDMSMLAAYQAYLIFSLVLYFKLDQKSSPFLRQAMTNLQTLACSASRRGIVCIAEQRRSLPRWEAWITTEAKRRTIYTMYLFDSVLSAQDGLPTMLGTELTGLPAPSDRLLWRASTRQDFERAYTIHLNDWAESFRIDELWPVPEDLSDADVQKRRERVDQWLEGIDEFGTMMYAVTSCTHGV